jgi:hypothetical protein
MTARSLTHMAFKKSFLLSGIDRVLPAGDDRAVTDEELTEGIFLPVCRPGRRGVTGAMTVMP